jgi:hypothetical protein
MSDQTVLLEDEYLEAAIELRGIVEQRKFLEAREAECREILAKAIAEGEKGVDCDGNELVQVRAGSLRFDHDQAERVLPKEILGSVTVLTIDAKKAKAILAPALYESCCKRTRPSVVAL